MATFERRTRGRVSRRGMLQTLGYVGVGSLVPLPRDVEGSTQQRTLTRPPISDETVTRGSANAAVDPFGLPDEAAEIFRPLTARSRVLVVQLSQGLNYLGQPSDFVTRYEVAAFASALQNLFAVNGRAENARAGFRRERTIREDRNTHFDNQIKASLELQSQHETELRLVAETIRDNTAAIQTLNTEVDKQADVVVTLHDTFDEACKNFSQGGCDLAGMVKALTTFIAVASAIYTGGASLVAAVGTGLAGVRGAIGAAGGASDPASFIDGVRKGYDSVVKVVDTVGTEWPQMQAAFGKYRDLVTAPGSNVKLVADAGALAAQLERFEAEVDRARAPEDARAAFKEGVRRYYALVQTRNNKLLETDALLLRQGALRAQIELRKEEQGKLGSLKAANRNPEADAYVQMLDAMSTALLEQMRILVWQEARALWLWSLSPPPAAARLDGITFADLAFAHNLIVSEFTLRESLAPGAAESFTNHRVSFPLAAASIAGLRKDSKLALVVSRRHFPQEWYGIYVTKVDVVLNGDQTFTATLTHPGRGQFEGAERGDLQVFSMKPRTSSVGHDRTADLGAQDGKYVGLSPYTAWLLAFTGSLPSFESITNVQLVFQGKFRTRPAG